jgi:hypothetical protein
LLYLETVNNDFVAGETKLARNDQRESSIVVEPSTGKLVEATGMRVPGAMLQYSRVKVRFWKRASLNCNEEEKNSYLALSHRFLNHFINVYRTVSLDIDVYPLSYREFCEVRDGQTLQFQKICSQKGIFETGSIFGLSGVTTPPLALGDDKHREIERILAEGTQPPIVDILLLNSKAYLRDGERRLAIVELGAVVDIVIEQVALNVAEVDSDDMRRKLERMNSKPIAETVIQPNINECLVESKEYCSWRDRFCNLRNKVIHMNLLPMRQKNP